MPTLTIDGKSFEFQPGETVIKAATRNNIEIPYYCWHPKLSVAANCRMCLVDLEKSPKLVPACQTDCKEGMVIHTDNQKVKDAQKSVQEFLLVNHPIDCPICDQAGECKLQDYYMKFDLQTSRMNDLKVSKPRLEILGPHVAYNAERCIMCTRCVRFMDEIAGERQLGVFNRGDHAVIGTFPGQPLDNPYSLNTVDVCPVGALTSTVFRFKQRVWNLKRSPSLCGGCARGCNTHVDHRVGQVYRMLPRENDAVNQSWLCDAGRLTYQESNEHRISSAYIKTGDGVVMSEVDQALQKAATLLAPVAQARKGLAAALSLHATIEDAYVFGRVAKEVLGVETVAWLGYNDWQGDKLLRVADRNPNRAGISRVLGDLGLTVVGQDELTKRIQSGVIKGLLCVGSECDNFGSLVDVCKNLEVLVHITDKQTAMMTYAAVTLPSLGAVQVDGLWMNFENRLQRLVPAFSGAGVAKASHVWLVEIASRLGVTFPLGSVPTIRAEIERRCASFAGSQLHEVSLAGKILGSA